MTDHKAEPGKFRATDAQIAEWQERHGLRIHASDAREAFEDAESLHMLHTPGNRGLVSEDGAVAEVVVSGGFADLRWLAAIAPDLPTGTRLYLRPPTAAPAASEGEESAAMTDHKAEHVAVLRELRDSDYAVDEGAGMRFTLERAALDAAIAALTAAPAASEGEDGAGVAFDSAEALADWLETLHEADGPAVLLAKFEPAQVAARAIREHLPRPAAQVAATPKHDEGRDDWIDAGVLRNQLAGYAEPECRECDGSGVYYGNVCICNCVLDAIPKHEALTTQPAARRVTDDPLVAKLIAAARGVREFPSFTALNHLSAMLAAVEAAESFAQPAEGVSE